jgi:hypothetical protein
MDFPALLVVLSHAGTSSRNLSLLLAPSTPAKISDDRRWRTVPYSDDRRWRTVPYSVPVQHLAFLKKSKS